MLPNDTPVKPMENIHKRTLPNRRDNGSHSGTENEDGTM